MMFFMQTLKGYHNGRHEKSLSFLFPLALLFCLTLLLYWRMLDNFFYYDDFEWLESRALNLENNILSIFQPIVHHPTSYFTPLIYLVYWLIYKLFGLDPFEYHLFNFLMHLSNISLVIYFVFTLSRNLKFAMLSGLFFAVNFAITDAVIWPAAFVDTVMFFFFVLSLIVFVFFLKKGHHYHYILSISFFILSLSAKGTALVLPFTLVLIELHFGLLKIKFKVLAKYVPYLVIIVIYLAMLQSYSTSGGGIFVNSSLDTILANAIKIPITMFVPESWIPTGLWFSLLYFVLLLLSLLAAFKYDKTGLCKLGFGMMMISLIPLLTINWSFSANPIPLTESIRHRLYLGNLGFSIILGSMFFNFYNSADNIKTRLIVHTLLIIVLGFNIYFNQKIQSQWDVITDDTKNALNEFKAMVDQYPPGSIIYFINFPPQQGFGKNFFRLYFGKFNIDFVEWPNEIPKNIDKSKIYILAQLNGHIYWAPEDAEKNAENPWEHFYIAQFYMLLGKNNKCKQELDKATIINYDENLHYQSAITYISLGYRDRALVELKKAIGLKSNFALAYREMGIIYYEIKNYDMAISFFKKAIELNKEDYRSVKALALTYKYKGQIDKANEKNKRKKSPAKSGAYKSIYQDVPSDFKLKPPVHQSF